MKTKLTYGPLLILIGALLLAACDSLRQEVDPSRLTSEPQKLVVACFIAPGDTAIVVRVTRSQAVVGTTTPVSGTVANALVTFSDGSRSVTLRNTINQIGYSYYGGNGGYSEYRALASAVPIRVGQTYTLRVEAPGNSAVEAQCTVPGPVALSSVELDSAASNNFGFSRIEYYARLRWVDPANQSNFYRVAGINSYVYTARVSYQPNTPPRDTLVRVTGPISFDNSLTINDVGSNGQEMTSGRGRLAVSYSYYNGQVQPSRPVGRLDVYLLNVDENYYRYHDAVQRQSGVDGNPFAEPVPILTNIRGGLGCFGAYNRSTLTTEFK